MILRLLSRASLGSFIGAFVLVSGLAQADEEAGEPYQAPEFINERPKLPPKAVSASAKEITLQEAMQVAIEHNLSIVTKKQQLAVTREGVPATRGRFEPFVAATYIHTNTDSPPVTAQEGTQGQLFASKTDVWNLSIGDKIPSGATVSLDFTNSRASSSLGTALQPIIYRSGLNLKLTQPLLKGFAFSFDVPYADVLRAEFATERAKQDVLSQLIQTVRDTELAYWDVVLSLKTYQVQAASVQLGREQLVLTQRQIAAGVLPPSDMINAEGTLAQRELSLVQAESDVEQSADQLRRILNLPREAWAQPLLPVDSPKYDDKTIVFDAALSKALQNRPELKQRKLDIDQARLDARIASMDRLPQLDAAVAYGFVGQDAEYRGALSQLSSAVAPGWSASLNLTWTPFNLTANAQLRAKRAAEQVAHTNLDSQLLDLHTELRSAIRALDTAKRSVRAAGTFRVLAERSLDAEQRKFMNGTSSNFFIAQRQADVTQAQLAEVAALIRHQKAVTTAQAAMGVLLEDRRVLLDVRGK